MTFPSSTPALDPTPWLLQKTILHDAGVDGRLHQLGPGAELSETAADAARTRVIFVTSGWVTLALGATHFILSTEEAQVLPAGKSAHLRNTAPQPAKVLVFTLSSPRTAPSTLVTYA